jgi:hypothetical protein
LMGGISPHIKFMPGVNPPHTTHCMKPCSYVHAFFLWNQRLRFNNTQFLIHLNLTLKRYPFLCIDTIHFTCM